MQIARSAQRGGKRAGPYPKQGGTGRGKPKNVKRKKAPTKTSRGKS